MDVRDPFDPPVSQIGSVLAAAVSNVDAVLCERQSEMLSRYARIGEAKVGAFADADDEGRLLDSRDATG